MSLKLNSKLKPNGENSPSIPISIQGQRNTGTFINSGQGMGYPPKTFIGSDTDEDIPPHIPGVEDCCRTCLTRKVRCTCKPMSDWTVDLIDISQPDLPNPDNNVDNDRDDRQDQALPSDWSDQDNIWLGKTYDKVRPLSSLKPVLAQPPSKGDESSNWSEHLHLHNYRAKTSLQVSLSKPAPGWPKGIRTNPTTHQVASPNNPKDQGNIRLHITKITTISKEAFYCLRLSQL